VTDGPSALGRLVGDADGFVAEVFGRSPLHVPKADPDGFADLLTLDDVDAIVASSGLRAPAFRLVRQGRTLPTSSVTRRVRIGSRPVGDLIDVGAVHEAFADGATLVLQGLHRSWAAVAAICRGLERTLTHATQANAYLTPPVAQGLDLHGDPHDVFALQTHGVKRWVVHPPGADEPWDLELEPGDVLYLPAGTRHAAQTVDRPSLHLTIGVRTTSVSDLLRRAVDRALDTEATGAPLPPGWADDPDALGPGLADAVAELADRLRAQDPAELARAAADAFHAGRVPSREHGLRDLLELDELDDTTRLRRRPDTVCRLTVDGDHVEVALGGRGLRMPAVVAPVIERILALDRFRPIDLDDLADRGSREVLLRRLVREGLVTFDRDARSR
jgi:bifunctional lysine-specific demethylase and histidyl-hydroxylase NO66